MYFQSIQMKINYSIRIFQFLSFSKKFQQLNLGHNTVKYCLNQTCLVRNLELTLTDKRRSNNYLNSQDPKMHIK